MPNLKVCGDWRNTALWARWSIPKKIVDATNEYREEMDIIGRFVKERWILRPDATAVGSEMYKAYVSWYQENGFYATNSRKFYVEFRKRYVCYCKAHFHRYRHLAERIFLSWSPGSQIQVGSAMMVTWFSDSEMPLKTRSSVEGGCSNGSQHFSRATGAAGTAVAWFSNSRRVQQDGLKPFYIPLSSATVRTRHRTCCLTPPATCTGPRTGEATTRRFAIAGGNAAVAWCSN